MARDCTIPTDKTTPQALTLAELASRAGCQHHQARHFIKSRRIREVYRVGQYRVFSEETLEQLCDHVNKLILRREKTPA